MKEIKVTINGKTRTHLEVICDFCKNNFTRRKDTVLKQKNKYCSYKCSHEHKLEKLLSNNKNCSYCKKSFPRDLQNFYSKNTSKDLLTSRCKNCIDNHSNKDIWTKQNSSKVALSNRKGHLQRTYGMTLEDYFLKLEEQKNLCAICKQVETRTFKGKLKPLSVDHCHVTGKIRGLLCDDCNNAIGRFKDNKNIINNAIKYLEKYE